MRNSRFLTGRGELLRSKKAIISQWVGYTLKQTAAIVITVVFILVSAGLALGQSDENKVKLYRWVDSEGVVHYNEKITDIPEGYRAAATVGYFVPAKGEKVGSDENPEKLTGRIEELSHNYYRGEDDFYHIKGRVRNGYSQTVSSITVKVTFYDEEDNYLFSETTIVNPIVLSPGQTGEFHLMVRVNPQIDTYKIEVFGKP